MAAMFPHDLQRWALPLDGFERKNIVLSDYAENLLVQPCMAKAGYTWEIPEVDPYAPRSPTSNNVDRRLFNVRIAKQFGYHTAPNPRVDRQQLDELRSRHVGAAEKATLGRCVTAARKRLPLPSSGGMVESFAGAAYDAAKATRAVATATRTWRRCMRPLGISDLPDAPTGMPAPSEAAEFGLDDQSGFGSDASSASASRSEIRLAVADARCRKTSGYARALYDAEWQQQAKLVAANQDALGRVKAANAHHDKLVRDVIAKYGGGPGR